MKSDQMAHDADMPTQNKIKTINPATSLLILELSPTDQLKVFHLNATQVCTAEQILQSEVERERNQKYFNDPSA